jgi:tol-pal system protein YbgF
MDIRMKKQLLVSVLMLGVAVATLPAQAQLFGDSDEVKAARQAHEDSQDAQLGQLEQRLRAAEEKVRGLTESLSQATGSNEELNHQIQVQSDKIDRMQKDFAYRLCSLSAQQMGGGVDCASGGNVSAAPPPQSYQQSYTPPQNPRSGDTLPPIDATGGGGNNSAYNPAPLDNAPVRGRPPGNLGTLPMNSGSNASGAPAQLSGSQAGPAPTSAPDGARSAQYDAAMNLLSRAQYPEAAAAFRSYADANPGDTELSPQALYWVGNISYVRQDYAPAARGFAEVLKKYPKSQRAPDAMLKLAQSFMGMGQKSEGCTTLGLLKTKYPNASPQTLAQGATLRKTACTK